MSLCSKRKVLPRCVGRKSAACTGSPVCPLGDWKEDWRYRGMFFGGRSDFRSIEVLDPQEH
jgi:hypothetical protein